MGTETFEESAPKLFRPRKDMVRITFGHDKEYLLSRSHPLATLIEHELAALPHNEPLTRVFDLELLYLPQDRLLWAIINTLLLHWFADECDRITKIMRGLYLVRKKVRDNRKGRILFNWKDQSVQSPEITIFADDDDDGDGSDTFGQIPALPLPSDMAAVIPPISLPSLPRTPTPRR